MPRRKLAEPGLRAAWVTALLLLAHATGLEGAAVEAPVGLPGPVRPAASSRRLRASDFDPNSWASLLYPEPTAAPADGAAPPATPPTPGGQARVNSATPSPATPPSVLGYYCDATGSKCCAGIGAACVPCSAYYAPPSLLWGCRGESFDPAGRLLDWSFAGYGGAGAPLGNTAYLAAYSADIRADYGAKGDGVADDTPAFQQFVRDALDRGVLKIPPGRYVIRQRLEIRAAVVLQGAGRGLTTLVFPQPVPPNPPGVKRDARQNYFISFFSWDSSGLLANITQLAERGATVVVVESAARLQAGMVVRVTLDSAPAGSGALPVGAALNGGPYANRSYSPGQQQLAKHTNRVLSIEGTRVTLMRPLPWRIGDLAWRPALRATTTRRLGGVEALTIEFPWTLYPGVGKERGFAAISIAGYQNSWVRDVEVVDADHGVQVLDSSLVTVSGLVLRNSKSRATTPAAEGRSGGWGVRIINSWDVLVTGFRFESAFARHIGVTANSLGTVIEEGRAGDLRLLLDTDYGTLVSDVDFGNATAPWQLLNASASAGPGPAAWLTLWNVRASGAPGEALPLPPAPYAARLNVVGVRAANESLPGTEAYEWWQEPYAPAVVAPLTLRASMLAKRQAGPQPLVIRPTTADSTTSSQPVAGAVVGAPLTADGRIYGCDAAGKPCCLPANATCPACPQAFSTPSMLYGCTGELWSPRGRLTDYSYAGYRAGERAIDTGIGYKVRARDLRLDYGAVGDGVADDTPAFQAAANDSSLANAILYLPPGTYRLQARIKFRQPGLLVRGAGRDATTISIPYSLADLYGGRAATGIKATDLSQYSHGDGFIWFQGWDPISDRNRVAEVVGPAARGDTRLRVNSTARLAVGQWVRLAMDGDTSSLIYDMNGGYFDAAPNQAKEKRVAKQVSRIAAVGDGWVELERPLVFNVSTAWAPRLHRYEPAANGTECGIESLAIVFAWAPYRGHLKEDGYNALVMYTVAHCWVRSVTIVNSDTAVFVYGSTFVTVDGVWLNATKTRRQPLVFMGNADGHKGIAVDQSTDVLVQNFRVHCTFYHDLSISWYNSQTVFSNGYGENLNIDFHRASPNNNLFTQINHGSGSRVMESSGAEGNGASHAAAYNTLWNNWGRLHFYWPSFEDLGPLFSFVGFRTQDAFPNGAYGWWFERAPRVYPPNLFTSMVTARKARKARQ